MRWYRRGKPSGAGTAEASREPGVSPATREHGYMPQLDALRFFAVMGVIIVHNWQPVATRCSWGRGTIC